VTYAVPAAVVLALLDDIRPGLLKPENAAPAPPAEGP
jgi:hypothetical protein